MYKRIVLKLSGEALKGSGIYGIDPQTVLSIAQEIKEAKQTGCQIAVVVGAGNIWRGKTGEELGMDRAQADYMGMLGTIMNSLALQDALESIGTPTRVLTAIGVDQVAEPYIRRRAIRHLEKGRVVVLAGGTGSPFFSTDTTAALRAAELDAHVVLMAKNGVDGVYDQDPNKHKGAKLYSHLTHRDLIDKNLEVMDLTASTLCSDNNLDIVVFDMNKHGNIKKAVLQENLGTIISGGTNNE